LGLRHYGGFYWAPATGHTEVDFLIQRGNEFTAIEVKAKKIFLLNGEMKWGQISS
jgi:predicted AAA+ superfamily ATPase